MILQTVKKYHWFSRETNEPFSPFQTDSESLVREFAATLAKKKDERKVRELFTLFFSQATKRRIENNELRLI